MTKIGHNTYILVFLTSVLCALLMLVSAAFLPQTPISENVYESAVVMVQEGCYPTIADHQPAAQLDNWTDALMLMESDAMNASQLDSVLTNPRYSYDGKNPVDDFAEYVNDEDPAPTSFYVKYWMGFRSILRFLLLFFDYYQIKRYLAIIFFCLFAAVICQVAKNVGSCAGWLFALSVILVRPYVICNSLQFSCCFLIAFAAMLLIPWIINNSNYEKLFFMELGLITMYFDFYTTPIVTFGFPFIYMSLIRTSRGEKIEAGVLLRNAIVWLLGYGSMWLAKLLLTQAFTAQDAISYGFGSFFKCVGIVRSDNWTYNVFAMVESVLKTILSDGEGALAGTVSVCVTIILFMIAISKRVVLQERMKENAIFLLPAILPIIWFVVATEPTRIHSWFQYRGISVLYWSLGGYFSLILSNKNAGKKEICDK